MIIKQGEQTFDTMLMNEIPDLWHIAQNHPDPSAREAILKAWHAAHAFQRALNVLGDANQTVDVSGL